MLNSAHFFLRVDNESVFTTSIDKVKAKLLSEGAPIEITQIFGGPGGGAEDLQPKDDIDVQLHHVFVDSDAARERIAELISEFPHFSEGDVNTIGEAHTTTQVVDLEELGKDAGAVEWKTDGHTNPVRLRWLANTAIKSRSSRALAVVDLKDSKFDVRVQVQSKADKLAEKLAAESEGDTASFYPDFIVWKKGTIFCLDTKGGHLLSDAVARKLLDIKEDGKTKVQVRFISEGKQSELRGKAIKGGFTVWKMKTNNPTPIHVASLEKAVKECLR